MDEGGPCVRRGWGSCGAVVPRGRGRARECGEWRGAASCHVPRTRAAHVAGRCPTCAGTSSRVPGPFPVGGRCPTRARGPVPVCWAPIPCAGSVFCWRSVPQAPGPLPVCRIRLLILLVQRLLGRFTLDCGWTADNVPGRMRADPAEGDVRAGHRAPPDSRRPCPAQHCLSSGCPGALLVGPGPGPGPGRGRGVRLLCSSVLPGCQGAPQPSMTVEALGAWSLQSSSTRWNKRWSRHLPAILM